MTAIRCRKPEILRTLRPDADAVIEASAGTGKTFTIEHLLVDLLLETDTPVESILVVTFTEKATGELRARVRQKIEKLLKQDTSDDAECYWELDEERRRKLERALFRFDTAPIHTIHGFCRRVLNENAFLNRQLFTQELVDAPVIFARVFRDMVRDTFLTDPVRAAFLEAWLETRSIEALESMLLNVAGKRAEIRPPWDNDTAADAAAEAIGAMAECFDLDVLERECRSLHKNSIPKTMRNLQRIDDALTEFRNLGNFVPFLRMGEKLEDFKIPADCGPPSARFFELLEQWRATGPRFESALLQTFLTDVQNRLREEKVQRGVYDFQDLLDRVRDSLNGPFADALRAALRTRYRFAIVDEFQDTDDIQWDIFRTLFHESDGNTLYVVGDPKQAIYGFRGADVHTYAQAVRTLLGEGNEPLRLEHNFRSTPAIIDAYNAILEDQRKQPEDVPGEQQFFSGFNRYPHCVQYGNPDLRAVDAEGVAVTPIRVIHHDGGEKVSVPAARRACGERMATEIRRILQDDGLYLTRAQTPSSAERIPARDIFILTESGNQAHEAAGYLRAAGVPYAFYKQDGLFQTAEATDVRDLLAGILDPNRTSNRLRAWATPFFAVDWRDLGDARALPDTALLVERLKAWEQLAARESWGELFSSLIDDSGIIERELFLSESERELTNYLHLLELLLETAVRNRCSLAELIQTLDNYIAGTASPEGEEGNTQRIESERDAVQIMTLHKSKGLEASVVFLFSLGARVHRREQLYHDENDVRCLQIGSPGNAAVAEAIERESNEEKQRLYYVGLTRAKAMLYLPCVTPVKGITGGYGIVNRRLHAMLSGDGPPESEECFAFIPAGSADSLPVPAFPTETEESAWVPEPELLRKPQTDPLFARCLAEHRPVVLTSYSQMKKRRAAMTRVWDDVDPRGDEVVEGEASTLVAARASTRLPGGMNTGLFLHELLEHADLEAAGSAHDFSTWKDAPEQRRLITRSMRAYHIRTDAYDEAARLTWQALTNDWVLGETGGATVIPGIAGCLPKVHREMEFLYPFPEAAHPRILDAPPEQRLQVERGYIKGFVDLIFEYDGRVYFADWKSDLLPGYSDAAMEQRVQQLYQLQLDVYSLALVKMFDLQDPARFEQRFGGVLYVFLRGLEDGGGSAGIYFRRPSRDDILGYERLIMEQPVG